jgi:hypothetical protein
MHLGGCIICGLQEFVSRNRRRTWRVGVLVCALVTAVSCSVTETDIWQGAEFSEDGDHIRLAASILHCGCIQLRNISSEPVILETRRRTARLGRYTLPAGDIVRSRFDWAGFDDGDSYTIIGIDRTGRGIASLAKVLTIEEQQTSEPCDVFEGAQAAYENPNERNKPDVSVLCPYGPLHMDYADRARFESLPPLPQ